ncbi:MAG: glycerol-3-phosphate 1-O-acyltransferase PlsY [Candidatus Binatia bacterium]
MLELPCIAGGYLVGSIPTGVLLGRLAGVDVRSAGSGNIGATNVARTAGRRLGLVTLVGDFAKGFLPVWLARELGLAEAAVAAVAAAALLGHVFSVFLAFHGGKGVATGIGALVALAPGAALIPLAVFAATFAASRIVSTSSIAAAASAPVALLLLGYPAATCVAASAMALLIIYRHKDNIGRLLAGTEKRFASKS